MNSPNHAEQKAVKLLDELGIDELPVPIEEVAISLGAEIDYVPYDGDVSGMLYRGDDEHILIGVNSRHASTRQRFTIAHEIAHLKMHKGTPMFIDRFARVNWRNAASTQEAA